MEIYSYFDEIILLNISIGSLEMAHVTYKSLNRVYTWDHNKRPPKIGRNNAN